MTPLPNADHCSACNDSKPWEWVPPVIVGGKPLAGTGVWRTQLILGRCPRCFVEDSLKREEALRAEAERQGLVRLLGGEKAYRRFTFESFTVDPGNRLAFEEAYQFDPDRNALYLWGPCGIGKTHLAYAIARRSFQRNRQVAVLKASQLTRKTRMKDADAEQQAIDRFVHVEVWVLDDLGMSTETTYARQILQEILDGREFRGRNGLVVTSRYSLDGLAHKFNDDTIPSRLAGMCKVIEVAGEDHRLGSRKP